MVSRQATFDPEADETIVVTVVSLVANALGTEPSNLPPIQDSINSDALNALYSGTEYSEYPRVKFTYAGFLVTIDCTRRVIVKQF